MKRILLVVITTAMMIAISFSLFAQDYYTGKKLISYNGTQYKVERFAPFNDYFIENVTNHLKENPRYKIGSNPVIYYNDASGMGHSADADEERFNSIVRQVFTDKEIGFYKSCDNLVFVNYIVDPNNGRILEVSFIISVTNDDKTLLSIPIEKFNKLETLIKERLVCTFSDELKKEKQSYCISGNNLF